MSATSIMLPAPNDDFSESVAKAPLFKDLSDAILKNVCEFGDCRRYGAGQTIYSAGQFEGDEFLLVVSGRMRISSMNAETGAVMVEEVGPDEIFALELAFCDTACDAFQQVSATADDELTLIAFDSEAFSALAFQRPSLMRNTAKLLAGELSVKRFKTVEAKAAPEQRVFAALLKFVERDDLSGAWHVPQMPKHRELADEAGVEEAVTAGAVASLIQEGVARRDYPGLVINDMARLNELAS
ncbi:MAG: hypothetical protein DHS20C05_03020 [Hyphococcus sp.]|nr:MAG: hypothetical protein DHS20C05_03020 [Marinicaulis sp.]